MAQSRDTAFPGCPHHVIQRGNRRRAVFLEDGDRVEFLTRLERATRSGGVDVWAYVLMRNHVHLIAVPEDRESLSVAMADCLPAYSEAFRSRHPSSGDLWHERLYASLIPPQYLWDAVRYVERNPVRAGMTAHAEDYPWSSAPYHCGLRAEDPLVSSASPLKGAISNWSTWLEEPDADGKLAFLRRRARSGDGPGSSPFIGVMEHALDRRIASRKPRRRPRGKGRKKRKSR